jgi:FkbM family methyltransferase
MKHRLKLFIKIIASFLRVRLLFSGELNEFGLRNLVIEYYLRQSKGILHIGAHKGQEAAYYADLEKPVIWIEANPQLFPVLQRNISAYPNQKAINVLLGDENRLVDFYITNNDGLSSSVLPLTRYGREIWGIENTEILNIHSKTLDSLELPNIEEYDFWILDVQGYESQVIKGAQASISRVKWMLVECSNSQFYFHNTIYSEICKVLRSFNFVPILPVTGNHFEMLFKRDEG